MLEISLSTEQAKARVESLNKSLDKTAEKLEKLDKKSSMSFGKSAVQIFKEMRKEMEAFSVKAASMRSQLMAHDSGLKKAAESQKTMGDKLREAKKAMDAQALGISKHTKELASMVKQFAAAIKTQQDYATSVKQQTAAIAANAKAEAQRNQVKQKVIADERAAAQAAKAAALATKQLAKEQNALARELDKAHGQALAEERRRQAAATKAAASAAKELARSEAALTKELERAHGQALAEERRRQATASRQAATAAKELARTEATLAKELDRAHGQALAEERRRQAAASRQAAAATRELQRQEALLKREIDKAHGEALTEERRRQAAANKAAAQAVRQHAAALKQQAALVKTVQTPMQAYTARVNQLAAAMKAGTITAQQYQHGVNKATTTLVAANKKAMLASAGVGSMTSQFHLASQATAAFRATLMGAGLYFGIFTSATIAAATAAYAFAKAITSSLVVGKKFEQTFDRVAVVMGQFGEGLKDTGVAAQVDLVKRKILELGETTQFSSNQVADAAVVLAQAGLDGLQIYNALPGALNLAAIGMIDVAEASDIAVGVMYAFSKGSESMTANTMKLDHIIDILAATSVKSNVKIGELAKTLQYVAPIASKAGMSIEQTSAAIGVLANAGIKGSMAGTILRRVITELSVMTPKTQQAFDSLGIPIKEMTKDGIDLTQIFMEMKKQMDGMSKTEKIAILRQAFGQWAVSGAAGLTTLADKIGLMQTELEDARGTAEQMRRELQNNMAGALENLTSTLENVGIKAFEAFGPALTAKIRELTAYIRDNSPQIATALAKIVLALAEGAEWLVEWGGMLTKVLLAFTGFMVVRTTFSSIATAIEGAALGLQAFTTRMQAASIATAAANTQLLNYATGQAVVATASAGFGARLAAMAAGVSGFIGWLSKAGAVLLRFAGWVGILASVALPFLVDSMFEVEAATTITYEALEEYNEIISIAGNLSTVSGTNLESLAKRLRSEVAPAAGAATEALNRLNEAKKKVAILEENAFFMSDMPEGDLAAQQLIAARKELEVATRAYAQANNAAADSVAALYDVELQRAADKLIDQNIRDPGTKKLRSELEAMDIVIAQTEMSLVSLIASASTLDEAFSFQNSGTAKYLQDLLDVLKLKREHLLVDREAAANERKAAEDKRKIGDALKKMLEEYEKNIGSAAGFNRELKEVNDVLAEISLNSPGAAEGLKEMGYSASEATAALESLKDARAIDFISQQLGQVDSRYKNLSKSAIDATTGTLGYAEAVRMATNIVNMLELPLARKQQILRDLIPTLKGVADGTAEANKQFADFVRKTNEDFASFIASASLDEIAVQFRNATDASTEAGQQAMAQARVMKVLGGTLQQTIPETQLLADFQRALAVAFDDTALGATLAARAMKQYSESLPTGRMEKENENIRMQTEMLLLGKDALELYNMAYQDHAGNVALATDEYWAAASANIELRKEFERTQEVMAAFEQFGDGVAKIFADMFTGGIKSFKDFADRLKSLFKQLLADLIYTAIKNKIVLSITGQVSGVGAGAGNPGSNLLNSFFNTFTGGNSGSGTSSGSGGGFWNTVVSGIQRLTGAGGPVGGGSVPGGFNGSGMLLTAAAYAPSVFAGSAGAAAGAVPWAIPNYGQVPPWAGSVPPGTGPVAAPSAGFPWMNALAGVTAGYGAFRQYGNGGGSSLAAGLTYGVGTYLGMGALGAGATAMAGGATLGGGLSAAAGALGPVGWTLLAVMALNSLTGGKVFGTRYKPESSSQTIGINSGGGFAANTLTEVRQRSLFRGRQWRTTNKPATAEQTQQAEELYNAVRETTQSAARALRVAVPELITGAFTVTTDAKGKVTKELSTVLGKTYEEGFEEFQKRIQGENIINVVKSAYGNAEEIEAIAESYRSSAEHLLGVSQLMLAAQADIDAGMGLLRGTGEEEMKRVVALVDELAHAGENLGDAYARVSQSVFAVEQSLTIFGVQSGRTREEFVKFSAELVDALGGLEAGKEKLATFRKAFEEFGTFSEFEAGGASDTRARLMEDIGLAADLTAEEFMAAFTEALPDLSPDELASWIDAGNAIGRVKIALDEMRQAAGETESSVVAQVAAQIKAIQALGANEEELAEARRLGIDIIRRALDDFMGGIDDQLAQFEGRSNYRQIQAITRAMDQNIRTARSLGASEAMLGRIRRLAGYQIAQIIAQLKASITDLASQLYGQTEGTNSAIQSQIDASNALYDSEMARYEAAQEAIKRIDEYLRGLASGELAPGSWEDRLGAAQTNFTDMLQRARAGDPDALSNITDYADEYLSLARDFFGSTADYAEIYDFVTGALRSLSADLGTITPPTGGPREDSGSDSSTSLSSADRFQLALQLAQQIGELGLALDTSVFDLMEDFGINLQALAADLGINLSTINEDTVEGLQLMAAALGISTAELITELGIGFAGVADYFGVKIDELMAGNFEALGTFAEAMGVSVLEAVDLLGLDLADLGISFGFKIDELTASNFEALRQFAAALGVSIVDLGVAIGADIDWLGNSIVASLTEGLASLPDLPESLTEGIAPYLDAIRDADNSADLFDAIKALLTWISELPTEQADLLRPLLQGLGLDFVSSNDDVAAILDDSLNVSRQIKDAVRDGAALMKSGIDASNELLTTVSDNSFATVSKLTDILAALQSIGSGPQGTLVEKQGSLVPPSMKLSGTGSPEPVVGEGGTDAKIVERLENVEKAINNVARVAGEGLTEVKTEQQGMKEEMAKMRGDKRREQIGQEK